MIGILLPLIGNVYPLIGNVLPLIANSLLLIAFGARIAELESLEEALSAYVQRAAEKLRAKKLLAGVVQVFAEIRRFHPDPQYTGSGSQALAVPTS